MRALLAIAGVALSLNAAAATAAATTLAGSFGADCAPYDGSAFRIDLREGRNHRISLSANVPLERAVGRWTAAMHAAPGSASMALCRVNPELHCEYPSEGWFRVERLTPTHMSGRLSARFDGRTITYRFAARAKKRPDHLFRCG